MIFPNHDRSVLTWCIDSQGIKFWAIDSWDGERWFEATSWDYKVLYWENLPNPPQYSGGER